MTLSELIQELEWVKESLPDGADPEVLIAEQPNWPFEYSLAGVTLIDENAVDEDGDPISEEPVVFLAEGAQLAYLRGGVAAKLGWR